VKVNNVELGADSPMLTASGAKRRTGSTEFPVQAGIVEAIVGKIGKGPRTPGGGITGRYPEAILLHAIPNGASASSKAAAGKRKAEGQLADMPDLNLPVARGPFIGLYVEVKRPGTKSARKSQRDMHELLKHEGHAVLTVDSVQGGVDVILAYLRLPGATISTRGMTGFTTPDDMLHQYERVTEWRRVTGTQLEGRARPRA
jgi:hypothetical protein